MCTPPADCRNSVTNPSSFLFSLKCPLPRLGLPRSGVENLTGNAVYNIVSKFGRLVKLLCWWRGCWVLSFTFHEMIIPWFYYIFTSHKMHIRVMVTSSTGRTDCVVKLRASLEYQQTVDWKSDLNLAAFHTNCINVTNLHRSSSISHICYWMLIRSQKS